MDTNVKWCHVKGKRWLKMAFCDLAAFYDNAISLPLIERMPFFMCTGLKLNAMWYKRQYTRTHSIEKPKTNWKLTKNMHITNWKWFRFFFFLLAKPKMVMTEMMEDHERKRGREIKTTRYIFRFKTHTHQYPSPHRCRFGSFLQWRTIYKRASEQQVKSRASTMSESWPRIENIDPFFVTAAPAEANESFSLNVYAIPMNECSDPEQTEQNVKKRERKKKSIISIALNNVGFANINLHQQVWKKTFLYSLSTAN